MHLRDRLPHQQVEQIRGGGLLPFQIGALGQRGLIRAIRLQEIQIAGYAQIAAAQSQLAVFTACPGGFRGELRAFAQFQQ